MFSRLVQWFSSGIGLFEVELLWFAITVPALASIAFAFGGTCSLWMWWVAAIIVIAAGFVRNPASRGVPAMVLFFLWMAVLYVLGGVLANPGGWDEIAYHLPAVRLLADGWNPLQVRTVAAFQRAFGFNLDDMAVIHAVFQMKTVWVFNAVASKFTGDDFSTMLPLTIVLFPAVSIRVCRLFRGRLWKAFGVVLLYWLIPCSEFSLDAALALAAVGLLGSAYVAVRDRKTDVVALAGYTVLLMTVKLNGIGHAAVIWMAFLSVAVLKRLPLRLPALSLSLAAPMALILTISPFMTGWMDFGHPLYPHCSNDPHHPPIDLCADFEWKGNDDFRSMGYVESFVNAYVSQDLVRAYRKFSADEADFRPRNQAFTNYPCLSEDGSVPVHPCVRIVFWLSLFLLCRAGGWRAVMVAVPAALCIGMMPVRMLGYMRYVPWMMSPLVFLAAEASFLQCRKRWVSLALLVAMLVAIRPLPFQRNLYETACTIDGSDLMREFLSVEASSRPRRVYPSQDHRWIANFRTLQRRRPLLSDVEVVEFTKDVPENLMDGLHSFPGNFFRYDPKVDFPELERRWLERPWDASRFGRWRLMGRVYLKTLPRLIWLRAASVFQ